jgi:hypothetical protein
VTTTPVHRRPGLQIVIGSARMNAHRRAVPATLDCAIFLQVAAPGFERIGRTARPLPSRRSAAPSRGARRCRADAGWALL